MIDDLEELLDEEDVYHGPRCLGCGGSEEDPCEGGCIWATQDLCSRCA